MALKRSLKEGNKFMLRIFGVTYDHTVNYGSCFQAYALQEAINSITLSDREKCSYSLIPIRSFKDGPASMSITRLILLPIMALHRTQFSPFERKHMNYVPVKCRKDLPKLNTDSDAFICGSDVIWNPDLNYGLDAFYLDFADKYKFSYAASFGKPEVSEQVLEQAKKHISTFDAVSVREEAGLKILRKCTDKAVKIVCDPVILIDKCKWEDLLSGRSKHENYIFVYITHISETVKKYLDQLRSKTGLKIIYAAYGPKQALKQRMLQVQTPEQWLQLLHDAEYVVTNSFHATAFSVLFHKKFFTVVNGDKSKGINVRMNDFLDSIGLEDRIFSVIPEQLDLSEIDYTFADKRIDEMRKYSLEFLHENLEAAYQQKLEREKQNGQHV